MPSTRILIAPNAFKHSLNATQVTLAIQEGLQNSHLNCECACFPVGDGGDGTGELMKQAQDKGVRKIVLDIGGSATVDDGTGTLRALIISFPDSYQNELTFPEDLIRLTRIDISNLDPRVMTCDITILCDVDNRLLWAEGSAAVFGPQKGTTPEAVKKLKSGLATFAQVARQQTGIDMSIVRHGGAASGAAAGLYALLNARLVNGIDFFLEFTGFSKAVANADIVIAGEGSLDEQTLHGKGPFGVACQAKTRQLPVIGIAGKIPLKQCVSISTYSCPLVMNLLK